MSRKNPRQYAAALIDAIEKGPSTKTGSMMTRFVGILKRDRMVSRADRIVREVRAQWNRRHGIMDVTVTSATPLLKKTLDAIGMAVQKNADVAQTNVVSEENAALLGGAVIRYGDTRIDGSVKRRLQQVKKSMIA